jgi:adenylate cyclase
MVVRFNAENAWHRGAIIGAVSFGLAMGLWLFQILDTWEAKSWDWRAGLLAGSDRTAADITLILVDQNSLDWASRENGLTWPWPRQIYAYILNFCQRNGASAVAFDVLVSEPSSYGVADDKRFGRAVADFGRMAGAVVLGHATGSETRWPKWLAKPKWVVQDLDQWLARENGRPITFPRAALAVPEIAKNTAVLCNVGLLPDPDGVYRRAKLFTLFDGQIFPSLGLGAYLAANPDVAMRIEAGRLTIGAKSIPIDKQGNAILRFRGKSMSHAHLSAAAVLQSESQILAGDPPNIKSDEAFKNKFVFFGLTAPGLKDQRPAPVGGDYFGVEINATILDNLLADDFIAMMPAWATTLLTLAVALVCAIGLSTIGAPLKIILACTLSLAAPPVFALGAYHYGVWLPLTVMEAAAACAIVLALVANYAIEGKKKRFIKRAFKQYLSHDVISQLVQNPERLKLGGERRTISIFFSDLQDFSALSERLDPEELTALLCDYLSVMTDIIWDEGGTIDKYEGDAIIAFWNAPLEVFDHAVRAVRVALRCQAELARLRPEFKQRIDRDLLMRIGINTGLALVGNLGSRNRFDYTMIGDAVNLASRLEGANKEFGTYTMISAHTRKLIGDAFALRELARITVMGRKQAVTVFEPMLAGDFNLRKDIFDQFGKGLACFYEGRFKQAEAFFSEIQQNDPAAAAYLKKCRKLLEKPPENWEGVWVMTRK